ncbi:MAG: hypothetical protein IAE89_02695 [Anaerolineae bacterium]|nr:hypothetical protein [Anaerolineae bacterium]
MAEIQIAIPIPYEEITAFCERHQICKLPMNADEHFRVDLDLQWEMVNKDTPELLCKLNLLFPPITIKD